MVSAPDRAQWPAHIKALVVPPAWTDVQINPDPKAPLQVIGKDAKGRWQPIYSEEFHKGQAAKKFARLQELDAKFKGIVAQNKKNQQSNNKGMQETADCMALIMEMGVRPGSETDTGAELKAYGATTLLGKHVVKKDGKTFLSFVGKKGVHLNLPVTDKKIADMLRRRAQDAGQDGQIFPKVSASKLLDYVHSFDGGGFKTKDFRTLVATRTALEQIAKTPAPANMKDYNKAVKSVAVVVSQKLGNTPIIAMQSYINPAVFSEWQAKAQEGGSGATPAEHMREMFKRITAPDGGFTYQPVTDKEPKSGFALSVYPERSFAKPAGALKFDNELLNWHLVTILMSDATSRNVALGWHDDARMAADYKLVEEYLKLEKPYDIKSAYTNEFLDKSVKMPPINPPKLF